MTLEAVLAYRAVQNDSDELILQSNRLERNALVEMLHFAMHLEGRPYGAIVRIVKCEDLDEMLAKVIGYIRDMLRRIQGDIERKGELVLEQLYQQGPMPTPRPTKFNFKISNKALYGNYANTLLRLLRYICSILE